MILVLRIVVDRLYPFATCSNSTGVRESGVLHVLLSYGEGTAVDEEIVDEQLSAHIDVDRQWLAHFWRVWWRVSNISRLDVHLRDRRSWWKFLRQADVVVQQLPGT